jgi:hypothetical protein
MAWTLKVIAINNEREVGRDAERTRDAKACPGDGHVSDGAGDPTGSIECNRAGFQQSLPLFFSMLGHDQPARKYPRPATGGPPEYGEAQTVTRRKESYG